MRGKVILYFTLLIIIVIFFVISVCGAYGSGDGDSLIVADFSGMPGDTVVDSIIMINSFPVWGFSFRVVFDSAVLTPIKIYRSTRTDYFLSWSSELKERWLYHYGFASGTGPGQGRPPLEIGRGAVAYVVFAVDTDADSGRAYNIELQDDPGSPPKVNVFVDTLYNMTYPHLKNGKFTVGPEGVDDVSDCMRPNSFSLDQNYPNPFNPTTVIRYKLSAVDGLRSGVTLKVYNIVGQLVKTLADESQAAGSYSVVWDGRSAKGEEVSSGVYIYRLRVGDKVLSKRMVLLR